MGFGLHPRRACALHLGVRRLTYGVQHGGVVVQGPEVPRLIEGRQRELVAERQVGRL